LLSYLLLDEEANDQDEDASDDGEHDNDTRFLGSPVSLGEVVDSSFAARDERVVDGGHCDYFYQRVSGARKKSSAFRGRSFRGRVQRRLEAGKNEESWASGTMDTQQCDSPHGDPIAPEKASSTYLCDWGWSFRSGKQSRADVELFGSC